MYTCKVCSYTTKRKWSFDYHVSRKNPCYPEENKTGGRGISIKVAPISTNITPSSTNITPSSINITPISTNITPENFVCGKCDKHLKSKFGLIKHESICKGVDKLQCPTCFKLFSSSNGKYKHVKNVICESPKNLANLESENERLRHENKLLKLNKPIHITNINNTVFQMNNYDKPNTDHITSKLMAGIFRMHKTDANLILHDTVGRIYKNKDFPENNRIKLSDRSAYTKVYKGDKEITLPIDEVLQTILTQMSELCGDRLRDCEEEGSIPGMKLSFVKDIMDNLATDDRDDRDNRLKFIPYIKSALLE